MGSSSFPVLFLESLPPLQCLVFLTQDGFLWLNLKVRFGLELSQKVIKLLVLLDDLWLLFLLEVEEASNVFPVFIELTSSFLIRHFDLLSIEFESFRLLHDLL